MRAPSAARAPPPTFSSRSSREWSAPAGLRNFDEKFRPVQVRGRRLLSECRLVFSARGPPPRPPRARRRNWLLRRESANVCREYRCGSPVARGRDGGTCARGFNNARRRGGGEPRILEARGRWNSGRARACFIHFIFPRELIDIPWAALFDGGGERVFHYSGGRIAWRAVEWINYSNWGWLFLEGTLWTLRSFFAVLIF